MPQVRNMPDIDSVTRPTRGVARDTILLRQLIGLAAAALATYQIFTFAVFGTYFPLALFFSLACVAFVRVQADDRLFLGIIGGYLLTLLLAGAWSPDKGTWANGVLYETLFFIAYLYARSSRSDELSRLIFVFVLAAALNAMLVIVFRFLPSIEATYLHSDFINIFRNPKRVANYSQFKPNVFDADKAGGIFDNANSGAAFNMLALGCTVSLIGARRMFVVGPLLALFMIAIFCSGSKSALLLTGAVLAIVTAIYMLRSGRSLMLGIGALLAIFVLIAPPVQDLLSAASGSEFGAATAKTSGYRINLLHVAGMLFREHPIFGLGFGGWRLEMTPYATLYGLDNSWPPHNSLVNAWAQAGLVSAILLVAVFAVVVSRLARCFRSTERPFRPGGALMALLAVGGMSLGDPFPLLGNQNMAFPLGLVVAWGMRSLMRRQQMQQESAVGPRAAARVQRAAQLPKAGHGSAR